MRLLLLSAFCSLLVVNSFYEFFKAIQSARATDGIIRLIKYIKSQMYYVKPDYGELYETACKQGFYGVVFKEGDILPHKHLEASEKSEFNDFISRIGTTDQAGQLELCDEYISRFNARLEESRYEKSRKSRVNLAVSVLCAVAVFVVFI